MMLVLSRRPSETIRFPQLGISVSIVSVRGSRVQVGVDAPPEIQVLRRELESDFPASNAIGADAQPTVGGSSSSPSRSEKAKHDFRNQLNEATLGLHLAQRLLAAGKIDSADKTLTNALKKLAELEASVAPSVGPKTQRASRTAFLAASRPEPHTTSDPTNVEIPESIDVLLVEDNPNEQALMRGLLEMEGYRVHTASNGHEAMDCLQHVNPKIVLLDMMMPECNGLETLRRIRAIQSREKLPVFAVSGSAPDSIGLSIGMDGVDDWFPKPLNAPRFVQNMRDRISGMCATPLEHVAS